MDREETVKILSDHESRLKNLEVYQTKQNGHLARLEDRVNGLIWAFVVGEGSIILLLIKILIDLSQNGG